MADLIEQFGCEGFTDIDDLVAKTSFNYSGVATLDTIARFGTTGEKWVKLDTSEVLFRNLYPTVQANLRKEAEISFNLLVTGNLNSSTSIVGIDSYDSANGGNFTMGAALQVVGNVQTGLVNEFAVVFGTIGGSVPAPIKTGIIAQPDSIFYVTLRSSSESAANASDAQVEVFINGVMVAQETGIDWSNGSFNVDSQWNETPNAEVFLRGLTNNIAVRDISLYDGWSTAAGVAPVQKYVQDMSPTGVTAASYTNEGGAGSQTIAISDDSDTTYLSSPTASAEALVTYTPDALLTTATVESVFTQIRGARGGVAMNTIDIELTDVPGTTVLDSDTNIMTVLAPLRENVNKELVPNVATVANAFAIKIRNGS